MFKMSSTRDSSLVPKKEPQITDPVTVYRIIEIPKGMFSSGSPCTYTALKEMVPQLVLDPSNVIEIQENAQGEFLTSKTPPNCAVLTADLLEKLSNKSYRKRKKSLGAHDEYPVCYTCSVCSKSFKHNSHLRRHFNLHSREKKYKCDLCNKTFLDVSSLARHRKTHSGDKPWSCRLCSKSFGTLGSLRRHITIHNQECRPYHCDVCFKRFPDNSSFRKHILIHTGIKPHKCDMCNRSFVHIGDLNAHKRIHLGVKPFTCQYCSKAFAKTSNLKRHLQVHGNNRAFMCRLCGVHYNFQSSLTRHLLLHRKDSQNVKKSVYICSICETRFYDKKELKKHLLKHNTVKEEKKQAKLKVDTIHEDNNEDNIKTQPQQKLSLRDIRFLQRKLRRCREVETVDLSRDEVEHLKYEFSKEQTSASDTTYERQTDHVEYIDDKATFLTNIKFKHKNNINLEKMDIEIPNTEQSEIPEEDFNMDTVESEDDIANESLTVFHLNLTENATEPKDIVHKKSGKSRIIVCDSEVTDEEIEQDIVCKKTSRPRIIVCDTDEDIEPENIVQMKRGRPRSTITEEVLDPENIVRRKRGRPRSTITEEVIDPENIVQMKRGRPRSTITEEVIEPENIVQMKRGRPRSTITEEVIEPENIVQMKRGRPRSTITEEVIEPENIVRRKRGRPRLRVTKEVIDLENIVRRKRGRPRSTVIKEVIEPENMVRRKRGRPRLTVTKEVTDSKNIVFNRRGSPIGSYTFIMEKEKIDMKDFPVEKEKETEPKYDSLRIEKYSNQTTMETPISNQSETDLIKLPEKSNENMQNRKSDKMQTHQSVLQYSKHIKQLLDILEDEVESDSGETNEDEYITQNRSKYKNISIEKPTVELNFTTKQNNVEDSLNVYEEERNVTALQSVEKQNQVRTEEHIIVKGQTQINAQGKNKIEALQIVKENEHMHANKQPMVLENVKMTKHLECDVEVKNQTEGQTNLQFNKKCIEPSSDMLIRQPSETLPTFQKGSRIEKQIYSKEQIRAITDSPANNKTGLQSDAQKKQNEPLQNQTKAQIDEGKKQIEKKLNVQGDTQKSLSNFPTETGAIAVEAQTKKHGSVNNMPDTSKSENSIAMSEEVKSLVDEELEMEKKNFFRKIKLDVNKPN